MEWTTLTLIGVLLMGGIGALLWQRHRAQWLVLTRHRVRCPLYDCQATIVARTNPLAQPRWQHLDVATCSLHPERLVTLPERMVFVRDSSLRQAVSAGTRAVSTLYAGTPVPQKLLGHPQQGRGLLCHPACPLHL